MTLTGDRVVSSATPRVRRDGAVAPFTARLGWLGRTAVVHCAGALGGAGAPALEAAVMSAFDERATALVFDLGRLEHLDTTGLRTLLSLHHRARARGCATGLADVPEPVAEFLHRLCVDRSFPCYPTVAEAVEGLTATLAWR